MSTSEGVAAASTWQRQMYDHLVSHGQVEGQILDEYQRLAGDSDMSAAFRYLATIVLEDEARHHRTFADLAESIRQMSDLRVDDEPIPPLAGLRQDKDRITEVTDRLLKVERDDAKELKELAKELKDYRDTTLWGLLVELMQLDTQKHIMILKFMRDHANATD